MATARALPTSHRIHALRQLRLGVGSHRADMDIRRSWLDTDTMNNEQAVEWARRAKSMCDKSIDGDAATLLHWTNNDPEVAQAVADLRIAVRRSIDHRARRMYIDSIRGCISDGAQLSAQAIQALQDAATCRFNLKLP